MHAVTRRTGSRLASAELEARGVAEQTRVATTRGETPTDDHATLDLRVGWAIGTGINLRAGIENVFYEAYVNHLNAKNPFSGSRIPGPGRVLFAKVSYAF